MAGKWEKFSDEIETAAAEKKEKGIFFRDSHTKGKQGEENPSEVAAAETDERERRIIFGIIANGISMNKTVGNSSHISISFWSS